MDHLFRIKREEGITSTMTLNSNVMKKLGLSAMEFIHIYFGLQKYEVKAVSSNLINEIEIVLSSDVIDHLIIPMTLEYEIRYDQNGFHIGPIIGIVAEKSLKKLNENVRKLNRYVRNYQKVGGAIIAFSNKGVDREKKRINGYLYNPIKRKWEKGIYPYPLAIFKRTSLKKDLQQHFESVIGNRIFNSATFTKWEMYIWFNQTLTLKPFLPETKMYQNIEDIERMLKKHDEIYMKPIKGMQGKKVAKVEKKSEGLFIQYMDGETKKDYIFKDLKNAEEFMKQNFSEREFILQQSLNLCFNGSIIDFRVILAKDQTGEWKNLGIMGRNGLKGHIVSNRHQGGKVEQGDITLEKIFTDRNKRIEYMEKMEMLALRAAQTIENCGFHFGKLGIDVGIDRDGCIWLIEINHKNPNDFVASFAGDKELVNLIRLANMGYAKKLAGFE